MFKWMQKLVGKFTGSVETTAEIPLTFTVEEEKILEPTLIPQEIIQVEEPLIVDIHPPTNVQEPPIVEEHKDTDDTYLEKMSTRDDYDFERSQFIKDVRSEYEPWQEHIVPDHICVDMVAQIPDADTTLWLVLFSPEFLETMIYDKCIARERIMFYGDNIELLKTVKLLYQVKVKLGNVISRDLTQLAQTLQEGIKDMKFDKLVVVGNPPYQEMDGGGAKNTTPSATSLYHRFVEAVLECEPDYFTFIIPSRWMVGGKGLDEFREKMMKDTHIKHITHFPGESDIFTSVRIQGGVNYFLWEKDYNGPCDFIVGDTKTTRYLNEYDIVLQDNGAYTILNKIYNSGYVFLDQKVSTRKPFGLPSDFSDWKETSKIRFLDQKVSSQKPFGLRSDFSDWKEKGVPCYSVGKKKHFCDWSNITKGHEIINMWNVCIPKAGDPRNPRVISHTLILEPGEICTETYLVVNSFDSKEEAVNFDKYIKTALFRFLLNLRKATQNISRDKFSWVPDLQDYSKEWTDAELYTMFDLYDEERAYIESKIKPLD